MFISDFAIKRPLITVVAMVALVVFGLFALWQLPTDEFPDVAEPVVFTAIIYPGASPDQVEREILDPVEEAIQGISGVDQIFGEARDGYAQFITVFLFEKDIKEATQDIRDAISGIRADLPPEMEEPILRRFDPAEFPIVQITLTSNTLTQADLTRIADPAITRELRSLPGVAQVDLIGQLEREMTVQLRPDALQAAGVSVGQVVLAIQAQNLAVPVGRLESTLEERTIRLKGRLETPADFAKMVVAERNGQLIRLGQVADVFDGTEEQRSLALYTEADGTGVEPIQPQEAIGINVTKSRGYSTTDVSDRIKASLANLQETLPEGVTLKIVRDAGVRVATAVRNVQEALIEGAILTVLVVFLFLNSWRSTVITGVALPISVLASFIAVWALGFKLETMSLLGLSLAIGILIDDAIVVRENIVRHVEMGKDHYRAAHEGTDEIGLAVAATTFSIVSVFVPVGFMYGVAGQWFKPFALTIACSVLVSLFVSFSLDPMLSAYWADPHKAEHEKAWITRQLDKFNRWFNGLAKRYKGVIAWALDHRLSMVIVAIGSLFAAFAIPGGGLLRFVVVAAGIGLIAWGFAVAGWNTRGIWTVIGVALVAGGLVNAIVGGIATPAIVSAVLGVAIVGLAMFAGSRRPQLPIRGLALLGASIVLVALSNVTPVWRPVGFSFFPEDDQSEFNLAIETPPGSNLDYTRLKAEELLRVIHEHDDIVEYTYTTLGGGESGTVDVGNIFARLVPMDERGISAADFAQIVRREAAKVSGVTGAVFTSDFGGNQKQIQVQLRGGTPEALEQAADMILAEARQVPGAVDIGLSSKGLKPELDVQLNRGLAGTLGITVGQVAQSLRPAFAGIDAGDWIDPMGETRDVMVRLSPEARRRAADLGQLPLVVQGAGGEQATLPLNQVATIRQSDGPAQISHLDGDRVVSVQMNTQGRSVSEVIADVEARIATLDLPPGVRVTQGGEVESQNEVFGRIMAALGIAVMLMYLILVVQFGSFLDPMAILLSLPLSLVGVMLGLSVQEMTINIMSLIGVILLAGIVAKNAILLIDFAKWAREKGGLPLREALIEAGSIRLRPILMTTFALIAGMIPVALGSGEGAQFRAPMGVAVIGGVVTSTLLTLLVIPTFYEILDEVRATLARKLGFRRAQMTAEHPVATLGVSGD
jgi:HAE1 family hydrophobic/amphiphilic exporter-1